MQHKVKIIATLASLGLAAAASVSAKPVLVDFSSADFTVTAGSKSVVTGELGATAFGGAGISLAHEAGLGLGVRGGDGQDSRIEGGERLRILFNEATDIAGLQFSDLYAGDGVNEIARVRVWDEGDNLLFNSAVHGGADGNVTLDFQDLATAKRLVINTVAVGGVLGTGGNFFVSGVVLSETEAQPVAEPGILALISIGLLGAAGLRRRKNG